MTLCAGTRVGSYEIVSMLGAGGMGEVYRARDTKLGREVAIKVLPRAFTADPDRLTRFEREARALATLNHPNVATIHGIEDAGEVRAIVMELVEGVTLASLLAQGSPLPVAKALDVALQIADALDAAHEKGVIHRDLKPANVKVTPAGVVKVLDFGLAKIVASVPEGRPRDERGVADDATLTAALEPTLEGIVLGTAPYMSPEQARGQPVDKRTDIWAFGCVLFEMLAGRRAFHGPSMVDILAAIVEREPDWNALPAATPANARWLLKRCLEKDPRRRLRDIGDVRVELEGRALDTAPPATTAGARPLGWRAAILGGLAGIIGLLGGVQVERRFTPRDVAPAPEMRLEVSMPPTSDPTAIAVSPDGRSIVAPSTQDGRTQLWIRRLGSEAAEPLPGTAGAMFPFWSPDSQSIGFFADSQLKRIDLGGNLVRSLTPVLTFPRGGAWGSGGTILFARANSPLYRVPADGGTAIEATKLDANHSNHRFPRFLPNGEDFLFYALGSPDHRGVYRGSLATTEVRRLAIDADSLTEFVAPDHLVFARQGALWTQKFDVATSEPVGEPFSLATRVAADGNVDGLAVFSSAANGALAYRVHLGARQLVWFDRSGVEVGTLGAPDEGQPRALKLSPDGRTLALARTVDGNQDVWLADTARGGLRRFTSHPASDNVPAFSPDGKFVLFGSLRLRDVEDLYVRPIDGSGPDTLLFESSTSKGLDGVAPDGRHLLFINFDAKTGFDIWALPLEPVAATGSTDAVPFRAGTPVPVVQTPFNDLTARVSPDGRWMVYASNEAGRNDIYIQPFLRQGEKVRVSMNGGLSPHWRSNGRELFYVSNEQLMATAIDLTGPAPVVGEPVRLFALPSGSQYAVSPDGQRFLVSKTASAAAPISFLLNWRTPGR